MAAKNKDKRVVAEICLYGNSNVGAGWLVRTVDGHMLGTGEPRQGRSFTEAVWLACDEIRTKVGYVGGSVEVFEPTGRMSAYTDLNHPGYYGNLTWYAAAGYIIDGDQLVKFSHK